MPDVGDLRGAARAAVERTLRGAELEFATPEPDTWTTVLQGERKRTLPLMIALDERSLRLSALLCGAPDEARESVYGYLLRRNQRPQPVHFALDDEGDVILVGQVPLEAVSEAALDRVLGALLTTADEVFNEVLRRGFRSYIDAEQRWRASAGLPPNPISPPG